MTTDMNERDNKLIEALEKIGIPYGEVVVRFFFQDGVIVRLVVEDKKENIKI